jgi:hypothetical protein
MRATDRFRDPNCHTKEAVNLPGQSDGVLQQDASGIRRPEHRLLRRGLQFDWNGRPRGLKPVAQGELMLQAPSGCEAGLGAGAAGQPAVAAAHHVAHQQSFTVVVEPQVGLGRTTGCSSNGELDRWIVHAHIGCAFPDGLFCFSRIFRESGVN